MSIHYSPHEERFNIITHALGLGIGLLGILSLLSMPQVVAMPRWGYLGLIAYGGGMLLSYCCSVVYHALSPRSLYRHWWRQADHAAIYWHIAGSFAPICLVLLSSSTLWLALLTLSLVFLWAIVGTWRSFRFLHDHSHVETLGYVLMGLSAFLVFHGLYRLAGWGPLIWIMAEGISFITGAICYSLHRRPYMHGIFHLFVVGGTICHLLALRALFLNLSY